MKNILLILSLITVQFSYSQTMKDFFTNKTQVVFLGLDLTQARFIGSDKFRNPEGIKSHAFKEWNRFLATEPGKYSLQDAFGLKDKYYYNSINYFLKRNHTIEMEGKIIDTDYTLSEEDAVKNVSTYTTFEKEGLAVSFVVEKFVDDVGEAHVWVVFIDLPENRVIYIEKMIGKAGGIGMANFWARSIYDIVSQIEKRRLEFKAK